MRVLLLVILAEIGLMNEKHARFQHSNYDY